MTSPTGREPSRPHMQNLPGTPADQLSKATEGANMADTDRLKSWSELLDKNPPARGVRGADDLVIGTSRSEPGSMTRLEAAEQERRDMTAQALRQHRERVEAEENRLQRELAHITIVFGTRLAVA